MRSIRRIIVARAIRRSLTYPSVERFAYIKKTKTANMAMYLQSRAAFNRLTKGLSYDARSAGPKYHIREMEFHRSEHFSRMRLKRKSEYVMG